jgi:phosphatidylserine decarboxylase
LQPDDSTMTMRDTLARVLAHEDINFLLTNRIPRRWLTLSMARFSKITQPWIRDCSIAIWRALSDLDLSEAKKQHFDSLHDCFTRELREGARPIDPDPRVLVSPCDAIVGASGPVTGAMALQAKGSWYPIEDLFGDREAAAAFAGGRYVTLRLTATMYHRFHAPADCTVRRVRYIAGDTWNVNPIALKRIERLFCKNERAAIDCELNANGDTITLIPVAAILVASIRLNFLNLLLHLQYRGPNRIDCDSPMKRGQEMGWFEHGSTIIVFVPGRYELSPKISEGQRIKVGQALFRSIV